MTNQDPVPVTEAPTLQEVAAKRGWQTLAVALGIDVAVAVALFTVMNIGQINAWADFFAPGMTLLFGKSVLVAIAQFIIRRFIDKSGYNPDGTPKTVVG